MLQSNNSCLAQQAVPLLLHCICMPYGASRLCDEIENVYNNEDWMKRFSAGIRAYVTTNCFVKNSKLERQNFKTYVTALDAACPSSC